MKKVGLLIFILFYVLGLASQGYAKWISGYYRDDGTYVRGHERSEANDTKADNFGPSQSDSELSNPYQRDYDNDGISNMNDWDDDNDGWGDDSDSSQYDSSNSSGYLW